MRRGFRGLGEALKGSLTVSSQVQEVGKQYQYILSGFVPGSKVVWTSFKDGVATGEHNADYGHVIEANGSLIVSWTPDAATVGTWQKTALIIAPDGSMQNAIVTFRVVPQQVALASTSVQSYETDFLSTPLFSIGGYEVTPMMLGIGVGAFLLLKRR